MKIAKDNASFRDMWQPIFASGYTCVITVSVFLIHSQSLLPISEKEGKREQYASSLSFLHFIICNRSFVNQYLIFVCHLSTVFITLIHLSFKVDDLKI